MIDWYLNNNKLQRMYNNYYHGHAVHNNYFDICDQIWENVHT